MSTESAKRDLAVHFLQGTIQPDRWPLMEDEAVIEELVAVVTAISIHYNGGVRVTRDQAREIGAQWQPWRCVASWYLWRSLDPVPMEI